MATTVRTDANYLGTLYRIGNTKTPFTSMIGGLSLARGSLSVSTGFSFPLSQYYSQAAATQDVTNETATLSAGTPVTIDRAQAYNVCQIMKKDVAVSFAKQSAYGEISGLSIAGQPQPVTSELAFQKQAQLLQLALDIEYSFIRGTYTASSGAATDMKTRGLLEAISTNVVLAAGAEIDTDLIKQLVKLMYTNSELTQPVILASVEQYFRLNELYGFPPMDRNIGGVNISMIAIPLVGIVPIIAVPVMPSDTLAIADISKIVPVFCAIGPDIPQASGQIIAWVDIALTAAKVGGFWYTQIGLGYGHEKFHGKITGLADD
jgi:hypothetical protein